MTLVLVQTGETTWQRDGRIEPITGAPLTENGIRHAMDIAAQLSGQKIRTVHACDCDGEQQTARVIAHSAQARLYTNATISDLDFGLWQGLELVEIRRRQPRLCRQWEDAPHVNCPPAGETLADAQRRITAGIAALMGRRRHLPAVVVLKPIALTLVRARLEHWPLESFWNLVEPAFTWRSYNVEPRQLL
jgi:broad specificity phosphatase PhoE